MRRYPLCWLTAGLLSAALLCPAVCVAQQHKQAPPAALPGQPARALTLDECVTIALQRQPAVKAAQATLASAETNRAALHKLYLVGLLARDLPIRQQQSDLGVTIAQAGLAQTEWETVYAVKRCFWGWVYAREQETVVAAVVKELQTRLDQIEKGKQPLARTKLNLNIVLFQQRQAQAVQGSERALAALSEALGLEPGCPVQLVQQSLPEVQECPKQELLLTLALTRRGEIMQAVAAAQAVDLEACAQQAIRGFLGRTFALGSDIHSRPIPQGISNKEYRPGALGVEMPVTMGGHKHDRVQRAHDLAGRAGAVVEKTRNLVALELADAYLKWRTNARKVEALRPQLKALPDFIKKTVEYFNEDKEARAEDLIRALTLQNQIQAEINEGLYDHALALIALERITAGGFPNSDPPHAVEALPGVGVPVVGNP